MQGISFKIYNASAGSGKTFTLVKEYLKILFSSKDHRSFRKILAVTFTNKAVNEMKQRILFSLLDFGKTKCPENSLPLLESICEELNLEPDFVREKSRRLLKEILHNYAFFDVSTIDKFTHRLIRTFSKDLKLPPNFEVVLDINSLLEEAVEALLSKAGPDKQLTPLLLDFALEKIEEDKSWDLSIDLKRIGKLLFLENQKRHLESLESKQTDDFNALKDSIKLQIASLEDRVTDRAKEVLDFIDKQGLSSEDFPRETLPNHFKKILNSELSPAKLYANKLEDNLRQGKILKAGTNFSPERIAPQLLEAYLAVKKLVYQRAFLINAYKNVVPLTILFRIRQEVKLLEEDREQLPISSFNTIISEEIKNQPAPYIYERLGEKYRHFFIDEFQDTSEMQWNNLVPLIGNALEGEDEQGNRGSLLLVGDAKQAIYRWRGGKAEQFLNLIGLEAQPFVLPPEVYNLPSNFRSREKVIEFNNAFFTSTASVLSNEVFRTLFFQANQQRANSKKGGLVELRFLEETNDLQLDYAREVLNIIRKALEFNYSYQDICILTRKRKQGSAVSDFLMDHGVPVISSETLLLQNSKKVIFLVTLLRHLYQPENLEYRYGLLYYLSQGERDIHLFISKHLEKLSDLFFNRYDVDLELMRNSSVYDGLEYAIRQFGLVEGSDAYLTFLLDEVLEVEKKEGSGIPVFLRYWDNNKDKLSITAPENTAAVKVMTIHKSKGLEFPVVIFPFATTKLYEEIDPKLWLPVENEDLAGFEWLLVSKKNEVVYYGPSARKIYEEEQQKLELDAFNLLYVALTRAIDALYIVTEKDINPKGEPNMRSYSGLFIQFLMENELWSSEKLQYSFGNLEVPLIARETPADEESVLHIPSYKDRPEFKLLARSGMLWDTKGEVAISKGILFHNTMSLVYSEEDVDPVLKQLKDSGILTGSDWKLLKKTVAEIVRHPQLKHFYQPGMEVRNEADILTENGLILRPDRVILEQQIATVIDYKTGKRAPDHRQQLLTYAEALEKMGYQVKKAIIVYVEDSINPEFIQL